MEENREVMENEEVVTVTEESTNNDVDYIPLAIMMAGAAALGALGHWAAPKVVWGGKKLVGKVVGAFKNKKQKPVDQETEAEETKEEETEKEDEEE